jgi:PAS domain S-box-containing protein
MTNSSRINQGLIEENSLLKQRIREIETSEAERKRVEEALRASELRYQTFFETTGTAMLIVEEDMTISLANERLESLTGYTRGEVEGKRKWTEFVEKDDLEKMITNHQLRRVDSDITVKNYEFRLVSRDGCLRNILLTVNLIPGTKRSVASLMDITDRKQAEKNLKSSEELYRSVIENISDTFYRTDTQGNLIMVSPSGKKLLGYASVEEMIGLNVAQDLYFNPEDRDVFLSTLRNQGLVIDYEVILKRRDGTPVAVSTSSHHYFNENGNMLGIEGALRDITERKQAEKILRDSEAKFRALAESSSSAIFLIQGTKYIYTNPAFETIVGYTMDDLADMNFWDFIHPDFLDLVRNRGLDRLKGENPPSRYEIKFVTKNGQEKWVDYSATIIDLENKPTIMGSTFDITERKKAEENLRESEDRYKRITETLTDYIYSVRLEGGAAVETKHGPGCEAVTGYKEEDYSKDPGLWLRMVAPEDRSRVVDQARQSAAGEVALPIEHRIVRKDGATRWVRNTPVLHRDEHDALWGYDGLIQDITERKQAEQERRALEERLQRAEKMESLGQMAGGVAHDLNNILGILSGYSELLLAEMPEGHRSRGHAEKILQSTGKAASIIQDLLTLARRGVRASDVINLNSVVSAFLKTPVFEKMKDFHPRVTFKTECDNNLLNIKGSSVHLEKTLINLVSNAAEAICGKGEVTIRTESRYLDKAIGEYEEVKEGDYAVLAVSDTGQGIPVENREKIFEPFYTKKAMGRSGTGLGLAIVWGTVKDHGGYIDLQTEVGKGTTFTLYFPATREEQIAQEQKASIEQYKGKGESVLVVDDVAGQREVAAGLLKNLGYEVHSVSSGEEALEYLREHKVNLLVLDMIMEPGIDGLETYRKVLTINPKQKAIIVSGFSETERVREAQKLGAGAYVKKPYVMEKIGVAIRQELDRK